MHLYTFLTVITPAIISVQADCYKSGDAWEPNYGQAFVALETLCDTMSGDFAKAETRYACVTAVYENPVRKMEFWVHNIDHAHSRNVKKEDCILHLGYEISGCKRGGVTGLDWFSFRADPNPGRCGS
ncbi:hypothetical protein HBI56_146340 [Parastagonospora nodorum]|nr:hypothetical protein HBH51_045410 [Parastagonospora nodorum]KAH3995631.1 hypothetical protein HBI10_167200 [Parastagonospora nodorum]KAH4015661.1 hypothetical protein HBI13_156790 [Parastagonospora nodorum]KAH4228279.1 hypothetical protein HBI06_101870 [Parastagonospora nodorum]KAH4235826.1 hypothetical protein HBI05_145930 [Parastagonospora nodorum]